MRAVVQRVKSTRLCVDGALISEIPFGLTVFLGVKEGDEKAQAEWLMKKISALRVFEDENGKKSIVYFEATEKAIKICRFYNPAATVTSKVSL